MKKDGSPKKEIARRAEQRCRLAAVTTWRRHFQEQPPPLSVDNSHYTQNPQQRVNERDVSQSIVEQLQAGRQRALERLSVDEINEKIRQLEQKFGYAPAITDAKKHQSPIAELASVAENSGETVDSEHTAFQPSH
jgi:flagellar motility protein MotE (MotC chaperone)